MKLLELINKHNNKRYYKNLDEVFNDGIDESPIQKNKVENIDNIGLLFRSNNRNG
jgi:hypothetical protein